jgi:beta-phosphoglucomutase
MTAPEDFERRMFGKHNADILSTLFGGALGPDEVRRRGAEKESLYRELMAPVIADHIVPGVIGFLEQRHAGHPMAVASNAERANVDFVLEAAGLRKYFRVVIDGDQVAQPKPDPEIFLRAAESLGVSPRECIIFEDSLAGVAAARACGARVAGLLTTHDTLAGVDLSIRDFLDPELERWMAAENSLR